MIEGHILHFVLGAVAAAVVVAVVAVAVAAWPPQLVAREMTVSLISHLPFLTHNIPDRSSSSTVVAHRSDRASTQ